MATLLSGSRHKDTSLLLARNFSMALIRNCNQDVRTSCADSSASSLTRTIKHPRSICLQIPTFLLFYSMFPKQKRHSRHFNMHSCLVESLAHHDSLRTGASRRVAVPVDPPYHIRYAMIFHFHKRLIVTLCLSVVWYEVSGDYLNN